MRGGKKYDQFGGGRGGGTLKKWLTWLQRGIYGRCRDRGSGCQKYSPVLVPFWQGVRKKGRIIVGSSTRMHPYTSAERLMHSRGFSVDVRKGLMVKECHVESAGALLCGMGIHEVMVLFAELSPCRCGGGGGGGGGGGRDGGAGGGCSIQERA